MGRWLGRVGLWLALAIGVGLIAVGMIDLHSFLERYVGYGGTMTYNPQTIARFSRIAPFLGLFLIAAAIWLRRSQALLQRLVSLFEIPNAALFAHPMRALFLVSIAGLFLEVVLIRWISVEIRVFAYFKNLALLACFFGFGLGAALSRRRISLLWFLAPLLVLAVFVQFDAFLGPFSLRRAAALIAPQRDLIYWGAFATNSLLHVLGFSLIALTFLLVLLPFIPVGQIVARLISQGKPIPSYSVNIAGSLIGVWLYAVVSFLWLPPLVWFGLPVLIMLYLVRSKAQAFWGGLGLVALLAAVLLYPSQQGKTFWSPYQKLVLTPRMGEAGHFYHIDVNNTFYQTIEDTRQRMVHHRIPYQFVPEPQRVLIVGAGAGNDAAEAVRFGAQSVDAVDIDPVILSLGRKLHPEHPYQSEHVTTILDDARAYFKKAQGTYDLIVFARLDSHTLLSGYTNVRLDHYVYTRESLKEAKRLLKPEGVLVLSFVSMEPWLQARLAKTLESVFGQEPLYVDPFSLVVGSQQRIRQALARNPDLVERSSAPASDASVRMATDDWPYLYLKEPKVPSLHWWMSLFVVAVVLLLLRGTGVAVKSINPHFFFLGAAFLLLQFQGVSRFALLFGTTWFVNTVVISAFLIMILAANWYVQRRPIVSLTPYYIGLLASVLLVLIPQQILLSLSPVWRGLVAGLLQSAPVFCAGIIFATSLRSTSDIPGALASNLLGAVFGGLLESLSYVTGINGLGWVVMALYGLSWLALRRKVPQSSLAAQKEEAKETLEIAPVS
ncbi:MAG: methyltransferase domain-containing protein [Candidatus Omnitrophica bacterium]|nr:methyltransferase domain-containing protein [Candidatus Omnitrophota bacterium]